MKQIFHRSAMKSASMIMVSLLLSVVVLAQKKITGSVVDAKTGATIASASVVAKGAKGGATTAADGSFAITVPADVNTLVVSSLGYATQQVRIGDASTLKISLSQVTEQLTDVVVVGYGTRKVKDATGSVVSLSEKNFNKGLIASPEQLLQGRTAGVTVTSTSGEPGAAVNINIRGTASIRSGNNPLFVVDGVPLEGGGMISGGAFEDGSRTARNPLSFLNPSDIESISILKDASSAAIYGARGANGVVIITTKGGRGKGGFQFSERTSVSTKANQYDLANAQDFMHGVKQAVINAGGDPSGVNSIDKGFDTDWQDQIFQTGISQNYNLSWGYSKKTTSLRLSGSLDDQIGIIKTAALKRGTFRANFSTQITKKLKLDITSSYSNLRNKYAPITNNSGYQGSLIGAAIAYNPTYPIYDADGSYYDSRDGNRNPVEMLNRFVDRDNVNRFLNNITATYKLTNNLNYKLTYGSDQSGSVRNGFMDPRLHSSLGGGDIGWDGITYNGSSISGNDATNGRASIQELDLKSTLIEHTLTYDKQFKGGSTLNAVGGFSYQKNVTNYRQMRKWGLGANAPTTPSAPVVDDPSKYANSTVWIGDTTQTEIQSYFARVNYTLKDKYFLTATARIDGSSKFAVGHKYGTFPALAAKWRLLDEKFATGLTKIFNQLDVRANWGITGNQEFPAYAALALQRTSLNGSKSVLTNSNPNLRWEQTTTKGIGVDFSLFNSRLKGNFDYFNKATKDLLFLASYPQPAASADRWVNLPGLVMNTGYEIGLELQAIKSKYGKSFSWDINYNMTFLENKVTDFGVNVVNTGEVSGQGLSGAFAQTIVNNYPLFSFKVPVFVRLNADGNAVYANNGFDQILGSALPKFTAGFTNSFTYKKWNASIFMNAVTGFYLYNNTANALFLKGALKNGRNVTNEVVNSIESGLNPGSPSSRFLEKGDFVRLANASIGYNFDVKSKWIKTLNASLSGQNLALFTKYSGLDPEVDVDKSIRGVPSRGFDYTAYPKARTITIGLNIGF